MKAILRGTEENAIGTFNASFRAIKEAIKRSGELQQALTEPRLRDLDRARHALAIAWPFLREETDVTDELRAKAAQLEDMLERETFYRELPFLEQLTSAIESEYTVRHQAALEARVAAYEEALARLEQTYGWTEVGSDEQQRIAAPLRRGAVRDGAHLPIPQLRSDREACESRLRAAITEVHQIVEGERLVTVSLDEYFGGGIETEEQLEAALDGIREESARLIGAGKKVVLR
jgi:hypothetical protein